MSILDDGEKKPCHFDISYMYESKCQQRWDFAIRDCLNKFNPKVREFYIDEKFNKCDRWIANPNYKWKPISHYCMIEQFIVAKYRYDMNHWYFDDGAHDSEKKICHMCPLQGRAISRWQDVFQLRDLQEYAGTLPFEPWIMINISPDWKGQTIDEHMIKDFRFVIESYMKEGWFSEWGYALEGGGDGDLLHAHIVAKLGSSSKTLAMVKGHCCGKKNNHEQQLMKYAKKTKCMRSVLKRVGIQKMILNNKQLWKDKMAYLVESKKPEGHKNKKLSLKGVNKRYYGKYKEVS